MAEDEGGREGGRRGLLLRVETDGAVVTDVADGLMRTDVTDALMRTDVGGELMTDVD